MAFLTERTDDVRDWGDNSVTPPQAQFQSDVLGWAMEAISEGEQWLRSQSGYAKIKSTIAAIMSEEDASSPIPLPLSTITDNRMGKNALDLRSGLTDTKIFWEYKTNGNPRYDLSSQMATKRTRAWWLSSQSDMRFAEGISWCLAAGSCPMRLVYDRTTGEQQLQAWDPRDVFPVRLNNNDCYQSGYAVIARKENTVNYLRALYVGKRPYPGGSPITPGMIQPDHDGAYARMSSGNLADKIALVAGPLLKGLFQDAHTRSATSTPTADTFTIEVKDDTLNRGGQTVLMGPHDSQGRPLAPWSYAVEPGNPLYPRGRVIVLTRSCILYDGPSIYWHGNFSFRKLTLDSWPFSFFGKAPLQDLLGLQSSLTRAMRLIDNTMRKLERPAIIGDKNNIPKAAFDKIDTALAGLKLLQNPSNGKGIQIVSADSQIIPTLISLITGLLIPEMEFISGVKDVTNFAKLGQIPSSETIEKMMEAMSPAIRSRSRTLEAYFRGLAYDVLANFMEFETLNKRIRVLGPNGAVLEDMDYDPGTLVPDFVHPDDHDSYGFVTKAARERGPRSRMDRALWFLPQFTFEVAPGSLLKASEVSDKLLMLQLGRAGWVDPITVLERMGVGPLGLPPDFPVGILQRLQYLAQSQVMQTEVNPAGRKATAQTMPQMHGGGIAETK